jgi:hypothetical protein
MSFSTVIERVVPSPARWEGQKSGFLLANRSSVVVSMER